MLRNTFTYKTFMIILFYYSVKSVNMRDEWRNRLFSIQVIYLRTEERRWFNNCKALRKGRLRKVTKGTFKCHYYACIKFMLNFPKPIYFFHFFSDEVILEQLRPFEWTRTSPFFRHSVYNYKFIFKLLQVFFSFL